MTYQGYILVTTYCEQTEIDNQFIDSLEQMGLIECKTVRTERYILESDIAQVERMFRLHRELDINIEGLDAINHMLKRLSTLEEERDLLLKRLKLYE
jgi:hypothetical protein